VGKRSPILGYNHNVRYRGLVFHVQSEDSGIGAPHLFTHLFHHGVIVSTRKLVYDAGSAEESIKSLMQAQHKAVLKDLRRGHYDDKIDAYLGGTPGLLPRGADETVRPSEGELAPSPGTVEEPAAAAATEQVVPVIAPELSAPVMIVETPPEPAPPPAVPAPATAAPAVVAPAAPQVLPIPEPPTIQFRPRPALPFSTRPPPMAADMTIKTEPPAFPSDPEIDLAPEIEIQLEVDDGDEAVPAAMRVRDTAADVVDAAQSARDDQTRPTVNDDARRATTLSDGIPGAIRPSSPAIPPPIGDARRLGDRPSTINAATLPPARPISRPPSRPALSAPQVVSRPVASDDRSRRDSEAVEVYSPALPSAELPVGERPGQYAQHKRQSSRIPIEPIKNERSGGVAVPAGLGPPRRAGSSPSSAKPHTALPPTGSSPTSIPREVPRSIGQTEPFRSRTPTPQRIAASGAANRGTHAGSGVVMTRPAVIVGAPSKTSATIPRIRKAREDEGRGFGQGLISEKSLDEVILAYLSEDADEK
jgi:hypothetical protein